MRHRLRSMRCTCCATTSTRASAWSIALLRIATKSLLGLESLLVIIIQVNITWSLHSPLASLYSLTHSPHSLTLLAPLTLHYTTHSHSYISTCMNVSDFFFLQRVRCACSNLFCFRCGEEAHNPCDCAQMSTWALKCSDESETANWILANTKIYINGLPYTPFNVFNGFSQF